MNGDVYEIIVDGQTGTVPDGQGFPLILGTCTKGETGKVKIVGSQTDLEDAFGVGSLPEHLKDFFAYAGQDAGALAVRLNGEIAGKLGALTKTGTGTGSAAVSGSPLMDAEIVLKIIESGDLNTATYQYSIDGADTWSNMMTLPADGKVIIGDTGVTLSFTGGSSDSFKIDDVYSVNCEGNKASITNVIEAVKTLTGLYDAEYIHITDPTSSSDWAALGLIADGLWNEHKPTFFLLRTRNKQENETLDQWIEYLTNERKGFSHRFIAVCAGYGDLIDNSGVRKIRDISGIVAGLINASSVNQSIAEVKSFPITTLKPVNAFMNVHSAVLENLGYITFKNYAGINNYYIVEGRTLAPDTSDYKYLEALRTMFKATRLARKKALMYLKIGVEGKAGLKYMEADIENAVKNGMVNIIPKQLTDVKVNIPDSQDINNNGIAFDLTIFGIAVIRKIKMYMKLKFKE